MSQRPVQPPAPLPRRRHREHLSPHLRDPDEVGTGTAFAAFDDAGERPADAVGLAAAEFRHGVARGRDAPPDGS